MNTYTKNTRRLSILLLTAMFLSLFAAYLAFPTAAAEEEEEEEAKIVDFTAEVYKNVDEKLAVMGEPVYVNAGYELYYQEVTGEIAVRDTKTGQLLFSNPYDVASDSTASADTKKDLLSQIMLKYTDMDKESWFNTYKHSAEYKQIRMKKIKGGIRVEYSIGKEEKRKLVPRMIEYNRFWEQIGNFFEEGTRDYQKLMAYYLKKDANDPALSQRAKVELKLTYPITNTYAVYVFDPLASERELVEMEERIKKFTSGAYTFESMDEDHALVEFVPKDKAPPLFKMALEYYLDEDGLYVRMPANGIRFDESTYKLAQVNILPYMGAGSRGNEGYTFIPDGSGAIIRFEDIKDQQNNVTGKIYGPDYSFRKISGAHTQKWRMPVYGIVETHTVKRDVVNTEIVPAVPAVPAYTDENGVEVPEVPEVPETTKDVKSTEEEIRTDGFLAIIEDGDALAQISNECGANMHKYNTVFPIFTPRPSDQFNLDVASTGLNTLMTVVSKRKYSGNYIIRYKMLSGEKASYTGMANAYREYLEKKGDITKIEDTGEDIPLYLETFGFIQTAERWFGFPIEADTPLTTFEDTKTMIDILNAEGIKNIHIKMLGWANNGMYTDIATKVKMEGAVGGKKGFNDLIEYAKSKGTTLYPDFQMAFTYSDWPFDGFNNKKDAVKTLENKVASETLYDFVNQTFMNRWGAMVISPSFMDKMYSKIIKDYAQYNVNGISVASLGKELHSDHNKKNQINREDSQNLIVDVLKRIKEDNTNVWLEGGNTYTVPYASAIIEAPLDSSKFLKSSASIPFYGMVTHGYVDIAGTPINMAGDYDYELLKAIENGASPYFICSFQNTAELKMSGFDNFYSVDFNTWLPDIIETYNTLNEVLKPLRSQAIINHELIDNGKQVIVTYEKGTQLLLNYDSNPYDYNGQTIAPLTFLKIK